MALSALWNIGFEILYWIINEILLMESKLEHSGEAKKHEDLK